MNTIATSSWVMKETGRGFLNEIQFIKHCTRTYDGQYKQSGANVGNTIQARLPQRFDVTNGQALQVQNLFDQTVPITLSAQLHIGFGWSSAQETTELNDVRENYIQPAAERLANAADVYAWEQVYRDVHNSVGTPGTPPSTKVTYMSANVKLTDGAVPLSGRVAVIDPGAMSVIAEATQGLFNPSATISENYEKGMFGREQLGIGKWFQDSCRPVHTTGSFSACSPTVNGASQTGSSLVTQAWTSMALKRGDTFTIAGVNGINPGNGLSTGRLQQFTLTADASDSGGAATLAISPSIIVTGALKTVTASPANGAAISVWGKAAGEALTAVEAPQGMIYTKDAFAFVTADLVNTGRSTECEFVRSKKSGISIRMVKQYNIGTDQLPTRLDILIGAATLQARFASRSQS